MKLSPQTTVVHSLSHTHKHSYCCLGGVQSRSYCGSSSLHQLGGISCRWDHEPLPPKTKISSSISNTELYTHTHTLKIHMFSIWNPPFWRSSPWSNLCPAGHWHPPPLVSYSGRTENKWCVWATVIFSFLYEGQRLTASTSSASRSFITPISWPPVPFEG